MKQIHTELQNCRSDNAILNIHFPADVCCEEADNEVVERSSWVEFDRLPSLIPWFWPLSGESIEELRCIFVSNDDSKFQHVKPVNAQPHPLLSMNSNIVVQYKSFLKTGVTKFEQTFEKTYINVARFKRRSQVFTWLPNAYCFAFISCFSNFKIYAKTFFVRIARQKLWNWLQKNKRSTNFS